MSAADPYCPDLRRILLETGREQGIDIRDGGTVVVIQGPRFSTRAESKWFSSAGWEVINMTAYPEGWLARELELCYANISLITDYDVGVEDDASVGPVSHASVMEVFAENNERLRKLLFAAIPKIGAQPAGHLCDGPLGRPGVVGPPCHERTSESGLGKPRAAVTIPRFLPALRDPPRSL